MRSRDYQPGEQVPGTVYKIRRLIGAGGMGTVYDVEDTTIGKRYVLKTLRPKLGNREDLARRIQNEARTLARLHHPNIVEVITAGVTADELKLPYYLMERLSGQSLRVVLEKKGQLDLSHAYHIGIDLLDALDHAHDKGVIHRDVKPDNIFLHRTVAGVTVTKLLDFGIVSMLDASGGETAGRFLGTLRYAAPEQLRGEKPTAKTDLYSAGLVLYEIIAGRGPFDEEGDSHRIAAAHMHKFPLPVSQFVDVPRGLDVLLMAALAKNPDARPRDAFSFAASLRNLKSHFENERPRESTESRVTASAVISPASGPSFDSALSPSPASETPHSRAGSRDSSHSSGTLIGMPTPTLVASLARTSPFPIATTHDARAAVATTNSIGFDTQPVPVHDTEELPFASGALRPVPSAALGEASTEIQWPREWAPLLSDGPQVRSLPAPTAPRRAVRSRTFGLAGAVVTVAVVLGLVVSFRHGRTPRARVVDTSPAVAFPTQAELPKLEVFLPPATIATVRLEATSVSSAAPAVRAGGVASATSTTSAVPAPSHVRLAAPASKPRPVRPPPALPDRPGPGF